MDLITFALILPQWAFQLGNYQCVKGVSADGPRCIVGAPVPCRCQLPAERAVPLCEYQDGSRTAGKSAPGQSGSWPTSQTLHESQVWMQTVQTIQNWAEIKITWLSSLPLFCQCCLAIHFFIWCRTYHTPNSISLLVVWIHPQRSLGVNMIHLFSLCLSLDQHD